MDPDDLVHQFSWEAFSEEFACALAELLGLHKKHKFRGGLPVVIEGEWDQKRKIVQGCNGMDHFSNDKRNIGSIV
jgi:hypothetical protein